jgi:N-acylneuraminate cytidylyltransferase
MNIAFIPARGGSKSIPLKNIKYLAGKPLLYWVTKAANDAKCVDKVIVATDHYEIKRTALSFGFQKILVYDRDAGNATDVASTESVMLEYLSKNLFAKESNFFLIQATSPLLSTEMIDDMFSAWKMNGADSSLSVVRNKRFFWREDGTPVNYNFRTRPTRQAFLGQLMENGACYMNRTEAVLRDQCRLSGRVFPFEMPEYTAIEIDEPDDWFVIEKIMLRLKKHDGMPPHGKTFCFDIDGVLGLVADAIELNGDYAKNIQNSEMVDICNWLYNLGNRIIINTARGSGSGYNWSEVTRSQLALWGVKYHELHFGKPAADFYVDDKATTLDMLRTLFSCCQ